ncbi:MAG TPA: CocE/NonD family hydrolase [Vicinamibacterales bacterium]|nr:CocE/NonD family hydrolase [Vicinamibacterales bacterium]HOQ59005.1 CocE/NonD family hydrolase [Vicinamibacterales bacterium]HPK71108.1 CocE/NonD family hydrolase [Vicinamibacterales bacterium]
MTRSTRPEQPRSRAIAAAAPALLALLVLLVLPLGARQQAPANPDRVRERYTKHEFRVPMRDGARLFTSVYVPKDRSKQYPFLISRTPYSVAPYGADSYRASLGPSPQFEEEGFIFVYQDARGRYMSEGEFKQVRPHVPVKRGPRDVDESSDMHDTIEWLLANVAGHNGRAGLVGVSQGGFHVAAGMIDAHPALKAASPQAPTADYYLGDDVYHNGAFMLAANFGFYSSFRPRDGGPQLPRAEPRFDPGNPDGYQFFLSIPPLAEVNAALFGGRAGYWQEIVDHPTYDEFWQSRSIWRHAKGITPAVLHVGGWFDAEDPMGALRMYRAIERQSPGTDNYLVMGPWSHGGWNRGPGDALGNATFAVKTGEVFRDRMQFAFFMHYLKDAPLPGGFPKAWMFATGVNEFRRHDAWPPAGVRPVAMSLEPGGKLAGLGPAAPGTAASAPRAPRSDAASFDEYVSDPNRPVPYIGYVAPGMTYDYMTEDQRFAATRPDVLVYASEPLAEDLTVAGPVAVSLKASSSGTDCDFVVKLIDAYPYDYPQPGQEQSAAGRGGRPAVRPPSNEVRMGGYQQLVRGEPFRAKFRRSFETPEPLEPGKPFEIRFELPDVYHVFRPGHRVIVQVQSSWFPLVDRNPQQFMDIPKARPGDFRKATQRVYHGSTLTLLVESKR